MLVQLAAVLLYRVRYSGQLNFPRAGPLIVVSNHQSHFDPPLIGMGTRRQMNYVARGTLFGFAPFRWLITSLGAIRIEREGTGLGGIKESLRRLKRGEVVVLFPEGTRTRDGRLGEFHGGFVTLARRSGAAILPAAIEGAFDAWPRHCILPKLGEIHVRYGSLLSPEAIAKMSDQQVLAEVRQRIELCLRQLREHPNLARLQHRNTLRQLSDNCPAPEALLSGDCGTTERRMRG